MPHTNFSKYPLDIGIGIGIGISLGIGSIFSRFFQFGDHFFGEILVSFGHFLVLFWCLGTSWDIFGSLGGPGCRTQVTMTCSGSPRDSILDHFLMKNVFFSTLFFEQFYGLLFY